MRVFGAGRCAAANVSPDKSGFTSNGLSAMRRMPAGSALFLSKGLITNRASPAAGQHHHELELPVAAPIYRDLRILHMCGPIAIRTALPSDIAIQKRTTSACKRFLIRRGEMPPYDGSGK
jgi:hypothetical protein